MFAHQLAIPNSLGRVLVEDVLLREGPYAFDIQNASHLRILWLAATQNLLPFAGLATRLLDAHGTRPRLQPRTKFLTGRTRLRHDSPLPCG